MSSPEHEDSLIYFSKSFLPELEPKEAERLFFEIKERIYSHGSYKWTVRNCRDFVELHDLPPSQFISSLEHLFNSYFKSKTDQGQKGAFDLIQRLKQSKEFNSLNTSGYKIPLQKDKKASDFLEEMKAIQESYLKINQKTMIKFIYEQFETGYTFNTLERKYKDL